MTIVVGQTVRRLALLAAAAAVAVVSALVGLAPAAFAHASLETADPPADAALERAPTAITLDFTERPDPDLSSIRLVDGNGERVTAPNAVVPDGDARRLQLTLPTLPDGVYTVAWRVTSRDDGHSTAGSYAFGVGVDQTTIANTADDADSSEDGRGSTNRTVLDVVARLLLDVGVVGLLGGAFFVLAIARSRARRAAVSLAWAWNAAVVGIVLRAVDLQRRADVSFGRVLGSATGHKLVWEAVAIVVCGVAVIWALSGRRDQVVPRRWIPLAVAGAAFAFARVRVGHADAASTRTLALGFQWLHVLAVGAWIGALVWLCLALPRQTSISAHEQGDAPGDAPGDEPSDEPSDEQREARLWIRRFSRSAMVVALVTIGTGTARAIDELRGISDLTDTGFGQALLVKLSFVTLTLGLAAWNRLVLLRRSAPMRRLRLGLAIEGLVAAAVLTTTAVLSSLAPPSSFASTPAPASPIVVTGNDFATSIKATLTLDPGRVGPNRLRLELVDFDSGAPMEASAVSLRIKPRGRADVPPATVALDRDPASPGLFSASTSAFAFAGTWEATATVSLPGGGKEIPLVVALTAGRQRIDAVPTPGQPTIYTITLEEPVGTVPRGTQVQSYVDPGRAGDNEVHATFLDPSGEELSIASVEVTVNGQGAAKARRLSPGHFVADASLSTGDTTISIEGIDDDGARITVVYTDPVP